MPSEAVKKDRDKRSPYAALILDDGTSLIIDMDTGEVLEGRPPSMERLLGMALEAERTEDAWHVAGAAYKALIGRLLDQSGLRKVKGGAGEATLVPWSNEFIPGGERLMQWLQDVEFPPAHYNALLAAATGFNPTSFREVCSALHIEEQAIAKLSQRSVGMAVRLSEPKLPAPKAERRKEP